MSTLRPTPGCGRGLAAAHAPPLGDPHGDRATAAVAPPAPDKPLPSVPHRPAGAHDDVAVPIIKYYIISVSYLAAVS
jgi:hypothetical protein